MKQSNVLRLCVYLLAIAALVLLATAALREQGPSFGPEGVQTTVAPTLPPVKQPVALLRAGSTRYQYEMLGTAERAAYDVILAQLLSFPESVAVQGIDSEGLSAVFRALLLDQPLLFHVSSTAYKFNSADGKVTAFLPEYKMDAAEYAKRCDEVALVCAQILAAVPQGAGEFEKELATHDALVYLCTYDEKAGERSSVYGALVERRASCEGYARAMLLLLELQGMRVGVLTGDARNAEGVVGGHAWNKVCVDGQWYHLDATWDDPIVEDEETISHAYFNLRDEDVAASHDFDDTRTPCTATDANYFVRKGLYFWALDQSAEQTMAVRLAESLDAGSAVLELRMASQAALEQATDELFASKRVYAILAEANTSRRIRTDTVYRSEMKALRVIRIMPVLK
ncbi:MAG: hypothetical protein LBB50_00430 [Oscillospiraceae bacterium]|jgi:hypothetical protein|nr:hypothetical protein [Oscillospiraceae bacterium]